MMPAAFNYSVTLWPSQLQATRLSAYLKVSLMAHHGGRSNVMRTYGANQTNSNCYYKLQCGGGQYGRQDVTKMHA